MKVSTKKNDGVSPVIGTILLVAITVVLVAIISAVVMGMTGGIGTSHVVGVKVVQGNASTVAGGATLLITITGGDTAGLGNLTVYNGSKLFSTGSPGTIGVPQTFSNTSTPTSTPLGVGAASLSIVGTFPDGNQTIYIGTINLI